MGTIHLHVRAHAEHIGLDWCQATLIKTFVGLVSRSSSVCKLRVRTAWRQASIDTKHASPHSLKSMKHRHVQEYVAGIDCYLCHFVGSIWWIWVKFFYLQICPWCLACLIRVKFNPGFYSASLHEPQDFCQYLILQPLVAFCQRQAFIDRILDVVLWGKFNSVIVRPKLVPGNFTTIGMKLQFPLKSWY
jgi:hypothetical protein